MTPEETNYDLVLKYIEGKTDEIETASVLEWINRSEKNKILYFQIKDIADAATIKKEDIGADEKKWNKIVGKYSAASGKGRRKISAYLKYAAAVVVIVSAILIVNRDKAPKWVTVRVAQNQKTRKITLPDRTEIWLKAGSAIRYAVDFAEGNRTVDLEGDGFFEVAKLLDAQGHRKPFTVKTSKLNIRVLGTSFNVQQHYAEQGVVVNIGVVRVESNAQVKTLYHGDRVLLQGNRLVSAKVNADLYKGWMNGEYRFDNTDITEIKELLELTYNVKVEILNPLQFKNIRLSGRVVAKTEHDFITVLTAMLSASINKNQNTITIKPLAYD